MIGGLHAAFKWVGDHGDNIIIFEYDVRGSIDSAGDKNRFVIMVNPCWVK